MKSIQVTVTDEQYKQIKESSRGRKLTVNEFIKDALGFKVTPLKYMVSHTLPYGGIGRLAEHLGKPYTTVYNQLRYGTSHECKKEIEQAMKELGYE